MDAYQGWRIVVEAGVVELTLRGLGAMARPECVPPRVCALAACVSITCVRACVRERKIDWFVRSGEPWTAMIP